MERASGESAIAAEAPAAGAGAGGLRGNLSSTVGDEGAGPLVWKQRAKAAEEKAKKAMLHATRLQREIERIKEKTKLLDSLSNPPGSGNGSADQFDGESHSSHISDATIGKNPKDLHAVPFGTKTSFDFKVGDMARNVGIASDSFYDMSPPSPPRRRIRRDFPTIDIQSINSPPPALFTRASDKEVPKPERIGSQLTFRTDSDLSIPNTPDILKECRSPSDEGSPAKPKKLERKKSGASLRPAATPLDTVDELGFVDLSSSDEDNNTKGGRLSINIGGSNSLYESHNMYQTIDEEVEEMKKEWAGSPKGRSIAKAFNKWIVRKKEVLGIQKLDGMSWNQQFQSALETKDYHKLDQVAEDFVAQVVLYGKLIIAEHQMTGKDRTIPIATKFGGTAGGEKYCIKGILFKLVKDPEISINEQKCWVYGGHYPNYAFAMKNASHDLMGAECYLNSSYKEGGSSAQLRVPMQVVLDYWGYRLIAMPLLDLKEQVYGGGGRVLYDGSGYPDVQRVMRETAKDIHLAPHYVLGKLLYCAGDVEVHKGKDGKLYTLDLARTVPCESQRVTKKIEGHVKARGQPEFYCLLRAELLERWKNAGGPPLSPDAFTGFSQRDADSKSHNRNVDKVTEFLLEKCIPELAQELDLLSPRERGQFEESVSMHLHRHGVNIRHSGYLLSLCRSREIQRVLFIQIVTRSLKSLLRGCLRQTLVESADFPSDHLMKCTVVKLLNSTIHNTNCFWDFIVYSQIVKSFGHLSLLWIPRSERKQNRIYDYLAEYDGGSIMLKIVTLLLDMTGFELRTDTMADLRTSAQDLSVFKFHTLDLSLSRVKIKTLSILQFAGAKVLKDSCSHVLSEMTQITYSTDEVLFSGNGKKLRRGGKTENREHIQQRKKAMRLLAQSVSKCTEILRRRPRHVPANFERFCALARLSGLENRNYSARSILSEGWNEFDHESTAPQRRSLEKRQFVNSCIHGPLDFQSFNRMKQCNEEWAIRSKASWRKVDNILHQICPPHNNASEWAGSHTGSGNSLKVSGTRERRSSVLSLSSGYSRSGIESQDMDGKSEGGGGVRKYAAIYNKKSNPNFVTLAAALSVDHPGACILTEILAKNRLHVASALGGLECVRYLIDSNVSVNIKDSQGLSPLHVCTKAGCAKALIQANADPNLKDINGLSPLECVQDVDVARELIMAKAKVDPRWTPPSAAKQGKLGVLLALLDRKGDIYERDVSDMTALGWACFSDRMKLVNLIINQRVDPNETCQGLSLLHHACQRGHSRVVKRLLEVKANVTVKTPNGWTPFRYANSSSVKLLLAHHLRCIGKLSIFEAAAVGWQDFVKKEIQNGVSVNVTDDFGQTPLHHAANAGREEIAFHLLALKADPNVADKYEARPLEFTENSNIARRLLEAKASVDLSGWCFFSAMRENKVGVVSALLDRGENPTVKNEEGFSALDYAARIGSAAAVRCVLSYRGFSGFWGDKRKARIDLRTAAKHAENEKKKAWEEVVELLQQKMHRFSERKQPPAPPGRLHRASRLSAPSLSSPLTDRSLSTGGSRRSSLKSLSPDPRPRLARSKSKEGVPLHADTPRSTGSSAMPHWWAGYQVSSHDLLSDPERFERRSSAASVDTSRDSRTAGGGSTTGIIHEGKSE